MSSAGSGAARGTSPCWMASQGSVCVPEPHSLGLLLPSWPALLGLWRCVPPLVKGKVNPSLGGAEHGAWRVADMCSSLAVTELGRAKAGDALRTHLAVWWPSSEESPRIHRARVMSARGAQPRLGTERRSRRSRFSDGSQNRAERDEAWLMLVGTPRVRRQASGQGHVLVRVLSLL